MTEHPALCSLAEFAKRCGVTRQAISAMCRGRLRGAVVQGQIDLRHEAARAYAERHSAPNASDDRDAENDHEGLSPRMALEWWALGQIGLLTYRTARRAALGDFYRDGYGAGAPPLSPAAEAELAGLLANTEYREARDRWHAERHQKREETADAR
jgi:hypothetical protein